MVQPVSCAEGTTVRAAGCRHGGGVAACMVKPRTPQVRLVGPNSAGVGSWAACATHRSCGTAFLLEHVHSHRAQQQDVWPAQLVKEQCEEAQQQPCCRAYASGKGCHRSAAGACRSRLLLCLESCCVSATAGEPWESPDGGTNCAPHFRPPSSTAGAFLAPRAAAWRGGHLQLVTQNDGERTPAVVARSSASIIAVLAIPGPSTGRQAAANRGCAAGSVHGAPRLRHAQRDQLQHSARLHADIAVSSPQA
jgi:hypothetical protein